jgi:ABC transporter substrate binding protein
LRFGYPDQCFGDSILWVQTKVAQHVTADLNESYQTRSACTVSAGHRVNPATRSRVRQIAGPRAAAPCLSLPRPTTKTVAVRLQTCARTQTQTIPIVFASISAPVERGFVASLARPGGNVTGYTNFEISVGGKWLGLLKEVAPKLAHSATMFDPDVAPHAPPFLRSVEAASRALGMETIAAPVRTDGEVDCCPAGAS